MSSNAYRLLGFAVWRGGRWYLRRRLPSTRKMVISGVGGVSALSAAIILIRRISA